MAPVRERAGLILGLMFCSQFGDKMLRNQVAKLTENRMLPGGFVLGQSLEAWKFYQQQLEQCEATELEFELIEKQQAA